MLLQDETPKNMEFQDESTTMPKGTEETLDVCRKELQEWKDKCLLISADFQNFKRRMEKEQTQVIRMARMKMMLPLLEIVDNFERALQEHDRAPMAQDMHGRLAGFMLIYQELQKMLSAMHVVRMTDYQIFNPQLHEALMQVDVPGYQTGSIVDVLQQGYLMEGEVVRIAKVSVAR